MVSNTMKTNHNSYFNTSAKPTGVPIYPELTAESDAIKRGRIGGLTSRRDRGKRGLGRPGLKPDEPGTQAARCRKVSARTNYAMRCRSGPSDLAGSPRTGMLDDIHQANEATDHEWRQGAPCSANKRRTFVRTSSNRLVRMEMPRPGATLLNGDPDTSL